MVSKEQNTARPNVAKIIVAVIFIAATIAAFVLTDYIFGEDSVFNKTVSTNSTLL